MPRRRLLSLMPSSWVPYAELMRVHKPAGVLYIYFPYLYGSLFAACVQDTIPAPRQVLANGLLLLCIAFTARSIGCTWNDIVDRELDKLIERCRVRPLARGAISTIEAVLFMAIEYAVLFSIVGIGAPKSLPYLVPVIATGTFYPYAKQITHYAQLVLGVSLTMGFLLGCNVAGVDPLDLISELSPRSVSFVAFALGYVVWGMLSDIIYAFQDLRDDKKAGTMAMSIRFENSMGTLLWSLSVLQIGLFVVSGWYLHAGSGFFAGAAAMALVLAAICLRVDLDRPETCWWWFIYGGVMVGGSILASLVVEYATRLLL
ncbi:hypothetical protein GQ53DRAFT_666606 [Thozetella sp. PMI_491]|nr:hypothetical protein GQ53DRAFT_666606 [Thozetella sp. PMI_491]